MKGHIGMWGYQALLELQKGKRSIQELKNILPLYGTAFDFTISYLLSSGLAKKTIEDGVEYIEITDLGRSLLSGFGYGEYGPHGCRPHMQRGRYNDWW